MDAKKLRLAISGLLLIAIGLSALIGILLNNSSLNGTSIGPNTPVGEAIFCILAAVTVMGGISVLVRRYFKFGLLAGIISLMTGAIWFSPIPVIASIVAIVLLALTKEEFGV